MNRLRRKIGVSAYRVWLVGLLAALGAVGCAKASDPPLTSTGTVHPGGSSGSGSGSGGGQLPPGNDSTSSSGSGSSSGASSDDASPASDDAATGDDGSTAPPVADAGNPFMLPPITLPEGGASSGDGGPNACSTKICIDPVFDCPLQGCFNGCVNFVCQ